MIPFKIHHGYIAIWTTMHLKSSCQEILIALLYRITAICIGYNIFAFHIHIWYCTNLGL